METALLKVIAQAAGIGGISLGVLLLVFREVIRKNIFPKFKDEKLAYRLLRIMVVLVWSIAIIGIGAWVYTKYLTKNNFIFFSEILEHVFHVVNQMCPAFISI